jgi:rhodanese-related sulfurtransferase
VRARRAAEILRKNGYKQINVIGLEEYKKKGYKLVYPKGISKP